MENLFDQIPDLVHKHPDFGYFNSTNLHNPELAECKQKAQSQTESVLKFFQRYSDHNFNWEEVYRYMKLKGVPEWSVKRAISDLQSEKIGLIKFSGNYRRSSYGRKCRCYKAV